MTQYYIGLMTGTSLDSIDSALLQQIGNDYHYVNHIEWPMSKTLRQMMLSLYQKGHNELERAAIAAHAHAHASAESVNKLLKYNQLNVKDIIAIGSHGQTVRHQPDANPPYSIQLQNPALICELTGIDVIADFRSRDIAAGGQGAPLAPLFHQGLLNIHQGCVVNIGGIANISIINDSYLSGYDSGPGNGLMDSWISQCRQLNFDRDGCWAKQGRIITPLLEALLASPYFHLPPPKSSGRDYFNLDWLASFLQPDYKPADVQRTLLELTAKTISSAIIDSIAMFHWPEKMVILAGGGAKNIFLVERIHSLLGQNIVIKNCPIPEQALEATGFAWLAAQYCQHHKLPLSDITGAKGSRLLGAWYRA